MSGETTLNPRKLCLKFYTKYAKFIKYDLRIYEIYANNFCVRTLGHSTPKQPEVVATMSPILLIFKGRFSVGRIDDIHN